MSVEIENTSPIIFTNVFNPPIYYNSSKMKIASHVKTDLELIDAVPAFEPEPEPKPLELFESANTNRENENKSDSLDAGSRLDPIYTHLTTTNEDLHSQDNDTTHSKLGCAFYQQTHQQLSNYYTTDVDFLTDTQTLIKTYNPKSVATSARSESEIGQLWNEIKQDAGFKPRYNYMDWEILEPLNTSEAFLQGSGMYNIASPVIALCTPVIVLILPLLMLKMRGATISIAEYIEVLKGLAGGHAIGRLCTDFSSVPIKEQLYLLASSSFYIFSIYQNIMSFITFHANMKKIHTHFKKVLQYLDASSVAMSDFLCVSKNMRSYKAFNKVLAGKLELLKEFREKIAAITNYEEYTFSLNTVYRIGHIMKCFYELYKHDLYEDAMLYAFGFNSYIKFLFGIKQNISRGHLAFTTFDSSETKYNNHDKSKNKTKNKNKNKNSKLSNTLVDSYYAPLKNDSPVKNTICLDKSVIITGPNASGKTTVLKSTLINVILSQQFGVGFYKSATLVPYKHIHCYLNIPDTSNRDSLFQAEARRCREIVDSVQAGVNNATETHLCGFDELYSGTNPEEASQSTTALMKWLSKKRRVSCMLTTHFTDVCTKLRKNSRIRNCRMHATIDEDKKATYTYELKDGISVVKGGCSILKEMGIHFKCSDV
jgi:hypothetical protein